MTIRKNNQHAVGNHAELKALEFLKNQGLSFLDKNFHCPYGELDLIMLDAKDIVFVEVRFRRSIQFGDAIESIDACKQNKLLRSAVYYLKKNNWLDLYNYRFDVIGFNNMIIEWIKDAFSYE